MVYVKHGKDMLEITFEKDTIAAGNVTVGMLRSGVEKKLTNPSERYFHRN